MVPYMSQKNNEIKNNNNGINQGTKQELKEDENNKKIPAILVPAPLFYNPILKIAIVFYEKIFLYFVVFMFVIPIMGRHRCKKRCRNHFFN